MSHRPAKRRSRQGEDLVRDLIHRCDVPPEEGTSGAHRIVVTTQSSWILILEDVMKSPPGARFGHNSVEHQADIARRGWVKQQRDLNHAGMQHARRNVLGSVVALIVGLAAIGTAVLLAWSAGLFATP